MKKQILSLLLCLCMAMTLLPATAWADGPNEGYSTFESFKEALEGGKRVNLGECTFTWPATEESITLNGEIYFGLDNVEWEIPSNITLIYPNEGDHLTYYQGATLTIKGTVKANKTDTGHVRIVNENGKPCTVILAEGGRMEGDFYIDDHVTLEIRKDCVAEGDLYLGGTLTGEGSVTGTVFANNGYNVWNGVKGTACLSGNLTLGGLQLISGDNGNLLIPSGSRITLCNGDSNLLLTGQSQLDLDGSLTLSSAYSIFAEGTIDIGENGTLLVPASSGFSRAGRIIGTGTLRVVERDCEIFGTSITDIVSDRAAHAAQVAETVTISCAWECEHEWGEWTRIKEPTCGEAGQRTRTCSKCQATETKPIEATGEHSWNTDTWEKNASGHWHTCVNCAQKQNAAAHSYGDWTVEQEATASAAGSRYRDCTVCGYRETQSIPATGGSSGGSSGSSSGGGSGSSNTSTSTTRNPDGSTTTKTENKNTGTVTETTRKPDGSQTKIETKRDGTVTTTETDKAGNKTETVEKSDGSTVTTVTRKDGTAATVNTDASGNVEAEITLSRVVVDAAQSSGTAAVLPVPKVAATREVAAAPAVTVNTGEAESVKVEIPVSDTTPGTVAVIVKADGSEEVVKTSVPTENGVAVSLPDGATVKIVDNGKNFADVPVSSWAADAVSFSSARELFGGTSENTFSPEAPMTRAMMVTVLARFDGEDTSGGTNWYQKGMDWAVAKGVSNGSDPNSSITREQLATMLWRYSGSPASSGTLDGFTDATQVSDYAQEAMRWAVENGIISGYGNGQLGPRGNATRAQVAQMLKNFIEK